MEKIIIELRKFVEIHRVLQDETLEHFEHVPLNQNLNQISLLVGDLERALAEPSNENGALPIPDVRLSLPSEEDIREPIQNALYATRHFLTDQCTELADGILDYLNDAGFKVVRQ
jgi:hypothetical protein